MARLRSPATGPTWLPEYTRTIERSVSGVRSERSGFSAGVRRITASDVVGPNDYLILADCAAGAVTITLPAAAISLGRYLVAKKVDAGGNAMTLDGNASETIDGATTKATTTQYVALTLFCDGAGWWII